MGEFLGVSSESGSQTVSNGEISNGEKRNRVEEEVPVEGKRSKLDNDTTNGKTRDPR